MGKRLKILIVSGIFIAFYAMYYWLTPALINIGSRVDLIEELATKEFKADINLENPRIKMGLSPSIWLSLDKFELINKDSSKALECDKIKLKVNLLPLIFGKLDLSYFESSNLELMLVLDKNYKLLVGDYDFNSDKQAPVSLSKLYLDNYQIQFADNTQNKKMKLVGDYLKIDDFDIKNHIDLSTSAKFYASKTPSTINLDIDIRLPLNKTLVNNKFLFNSTITNLDLSHFSNYIARATKNDIRRTAGIINLEANSQDDIQSEIVINNLELIRKDLPSSIIFKDKLEASIQASLARNKLNIHKIKLQGKSMDATVMGEITRLNTKSPYLDLSVEVAPSKMQDYVAILPGIYLKEDLNLYLLKKYGYYCDIYGKLKIKGDALKPQLIGEIVTNNGYIVKPIPNNTKKADVKLTFMGDKFLMDVVVPSNGAETVFVKGTVELYGKKNCDFRISSTKNIKLEVAESVLNPLHEVLNFEMGPVPIMTLKGYGNIDLDVKGNKQEPYLNGYFTFRDTTASFNDINMFLKNASGRLDFKHQDTHFVTNQAFLEGKPMKIDGTCTLKGELDFDAFANAQDLGFLLNILKTSPMLKDLGNLVKPIEKASGQANLTLKIYGKVKDINDVIFGKTIFAKGNVKLINDSVSIQNLPEIKNVSGFINFDNLDLFVDLNSMFNKSKVIIKGAIKSNFADISIAAKKFNIEDVGGMLANEPNIKYLELLKGLEVDFSAIYKGPISKIDLNKLKMNSKLSFHNTKLKNVPVSFIGGDIELKNNLVLINNVNILANSMPLFLSGKISNILSSPNLDVYVNAKPNQLFVEKYINKNAIYPLKLKGDITYSGKITGSFLSPRVKSKINMEEDAQIYYLGGTIGDDENAMNILSDIIFNKNFINIINFQINKLISSQNDKLFVTPQLSAKGMIGLAPNDMNFKGLKIKTQRATDAKIFNIIFKKPLIKQGQFNSDLSLNGNWKNPKIIGRINFTGVNLPIVDTTVKDVSFDFNPLLVLVNAAGEIFGNDIALSAAMKNSFLEPYVFEEINLNFANLDMNAIFKTLNKLELEGQGTNLSTGLKPESVIIKAAQIQAQSATIKNINAKNLMASLSINEKMLLSVDKFRLNVAQGSLNGDADYNLLNNKLRFSMAIKDVNANSISEALFDLPNQIHGNINGDVELSCNGKNHKTCMRTLAGNGGFEVNDGRMPKLGSLEYLLKAGNLVRSGLTGLSINGIIDLITPLKTGNFKTIRGNFEISQGIANSIQIFSKGKDLSLFLSGTYNFSTLIADMTVLGRLSKKITTVLGPIGNLSINSLFNQIPGVDLTGRMSVVNEINKIPGLDLNENLYRIFTVKIYGDINGDNYVQSFQWVE